MKWLLIAAATASLVLGSAAAPAGAGADLRIEGGSTEVTDMLALGCDEHIRFSGTLRWVTTFVSTPTNRRLMVVRFVDANMIGVGETTGTTYRLVLILGQTNMELNDRLVVDTEELTYKVFGGGQIFTVRGLTHITVTSSGLTVSFSDQTVDGCTPR